MRCAKARRILHLNREGEVSARLLRAAREHAARCPVCSAELQLIVRADTVVDNLRSVQPVLCDEAGLAMQVMRAVTAERSHASQAFVRERLLMRLQLASAVALAVIVVLFFAQTYRDARALETLEARLGRQAATTTAPPPFSLSSEQLAASVGRAQQLLAGESRQLQAGPPFGIALGTLLDLAQQSSQENKPEMERLRERYPDLWTISLGNGLDAHERAILATQGRAFLQEMQTLINLARPLHEE